MQKYTLLPYFPYGGSSSWGFKFQLLFGSGSTAVSEQERGSPEASLWGRVESRIFFFFSVDGLSAEWLNPPRGMCVKTMEHSVRNTEHPGFST